MPSEQTLRLLRAMAKEPSTWRHGYDLGQETELKAGSLYPILMRLSDRGWLEESWESDPPAGRPPRHLYRLTQAGLDAIASLGESQPDPGVVFGIRPRHAPAKAGAQ